MSSDRNVYISAKINAIFIFFKWSQQVQLAPKATVIQVLQVSQDPRDLMGLKANAVVKATLADLGCAIHPCATVVWWGRIRTAKGQIIDVVEHHCKQSSGAHVEQAAILRKISLLWRLFVTDCKMIPSQTAGFAPAESSLYLDGSCGNVLQMRWS